MKRGRTRKQQRMDSSRHYRGLAERDPVASAARQMIHKAYSSYTVDEYMMSKGMREIGDSPDRE